MGREKGRKVEKVNNDFFLCPRTKFCLLWPQNKGRPGSASGVEVNGPGYMEAGLESEREMVMY